MNKSTKISLFFLSVVLEAFLIRLANPLISFFFGVFLIGSIPFVFVNAKKKNNLSIPDTSSEWGSLLPDKGQALKREHIKTCKVSDVWYLLPIFFSVLGGIIGYVAAKDKDLPKAKSILYVGIFLFVLEVFMVLIL